MPDRAALLALASHAHVLLVATLATSLASAMHLAECAFALLRLFPALLWPRR